MEGIRKLQFMVKGYRNFTKWDKPLPPLEGSLEGKNFVITGANSGIGLSAAKHAALRKANVYLVCRNEQRGNEAVKNLK
jgi:NADPH:quinone reductase-like Zn-dependent oxidoreductase